MAENIERRGVRRLDDSVISKIAAGEVVHRPENAIKELLENSLDAGSRSITITTKDGGMKLLQIKDDGHGIAAEDLPKLCARHTTSKISSAEDLTEIQTFGFRGEALASISHVAHVKIQSRTKGGRCAFELSYMDGKPVNNSKPKACSGNQGTIVTVEDMFYNLPTRRKTITNFPDEYSRVVNVVRQYAINNPAVSFTCKKHGENTSSVQTPVNSTSLANVKIIYGEAVGNVLHDFSYENETFKVKVEGLVSSPMYDGDKTACILFINGRLVKCSALKQAISDKYNSFRGARVHSFVYLSLKFPPSSLDVNCHPSKEQVRFADEQQTCEAIANAIGKTFPTTTILSQKGAKSVEVMDIESPPAKKQSTLAFGTKKSKQSDGSESIVENSSEAEAQENLTTKDGNGTSNAGSGTKRKANAITGPTEDIRGHMKRMKRKIACKLTGVQNLWDAINDAADEGLSDLVCSHKFVGMFDEQHSMIQHKGDLYIVNNFKLSKEAVYQHIICNFEHFKTMKLEPKLDIYQLLRMVMDVPEGGWSENDGMSKEEVTEIVMDAAMTPKNRGILKEYFGIEINQLGALESLPLLVDKYVPPLHELPLFLLHLITTTPWDNEEGCFKNIAELLARFYAVRPAPKEIKTGPISTNTQSTPARINSPSSAVAFTKKNDEVPKVPHFHP
eukprot:TRINITY_DN8002_c0_g1_i1.p1 TRINITY_DN8002_c0_g1~~TRINITY_DN8002_c0_g1_i1.p1  ORF type:complete len:675 (+),score=161.79 TRINITY_DN8002_c0_g1_i1:750-2774(+)